MQDGAVIGIDRTAVPVEWDEIKTQLMRLATELGPETGVSDTSVSRFIDSAANALGDGNGESFVRRWLSCPVPHGFSPRAAATSSTSSRTCRLSSAPCGTASSRSCCSRTDSPP